MPQYVPHYRLTLSQNPVYQIMAMCPHAQRDWPKYIQSDSCNDINDEHVDFKCIVLPLILDLIVKPFFSVQILTCLRSIIFKGANLDSEI